MIYLIGGPPRCGKTTVARRQIVEVILQARDKDVQAAEHVRRALEK